MILDPIVQKAFLRQYSIVFYAALYYNKVRKIQKFVFYGGKWRGLILKKRVLVYPCGTEIGLEIYRGVKASIHYELIGGSSTYDHGRFVYKNHIDQLPFITDDSTLEDIQAFNKAIEAYGIDFLYPAMDGVLYKFAQYRKELKCELIAADTETVSIARSKRKTYEMLRGYIEVPQIYDVDEEIRQYPVFMKPSVGQGSKNAKLMNDFQEVQYELKQHKEDDMMILEYLPGEEYTVDCFTNEEGKLLYAAGRTRRRVKNGISVNAVAEQDSEFYRIAEIINGRLHQRGGWFFQLKKNKKGCYSLLEIAARIAGTSSYTRNLGINLPLLTLHLFDDKRIDSVMVNDYHLELDRALYNKYQSDISYDKVYIDYDDTIILDGRVNTQVIQFVFQCINHHIPISLITRHSGDLERDLKKYRVYGLFDEIIHLSPEEEKYQFIKGDQPIFIDDSYGERSKVKSKLGIPVFDAHMLECLLEEIG